MYSLIVDRLLTVLNWDPYHAQSYANEIVLAIDGEFPEMLI